MTRLNEQGQQRDDLREKALHSCNAFRYKYLTLYFASWVTLFLIIALLLLALWTPSLLFVIEEYQSGKRLWSTAVEPGTWFHYEFTHSVALSTVIEKFKIDEDGTILLMEAWNQDYGAGLPYDVDLDQLEQENGFFIIRPIQRVVPEIHMQPTHLQPRHLSINDKVIALHQPPFARNHLLIYVKSASFLERIGHRLTHSAASLSKFRKEVKRCPQFQPQLSNTI